jgi:hypothetical protein
MWWLSLLFLCGAENSSWRSLDAACLSSHSKSRSEP